MASPPVFITQYEVLRSDDYVLIRLNAPAGPVVDGRALTAEVQCIALTLPKFVQLAGVLSSMAASITGQAPARPATPATGRAPDHKPAEPESPDPGPVQIGDWVVRH